MKHEYDQLGHNLDVLAFQALFKKHGDDIRAMHDELIRSGLDESSLGFWIWHIPANIEIYSPQFRKSLGFKDETDFPNTPDSWRKQIMAKDGDLALANYVRHVESRGKFPYTQDVTYRKKNRWRKVKLRCLGGIVSWVDKEKGIPKLMIGVHREP